MTQVISTFICKISLSRTDGDSDKHEGDHDALQGRVHKLGPVEEHVHDSRHVQLAETDGHRR